MSFPDFERAQYEQPEPVVGYSGDFLAVPEPSLAKAVSFGLVAAVVGSFAYALIGLSGWMVSIVAIGVAWLIARSMMTATGGMGGRPFQIAAAVLTYLAVSSADVLDLLYYVHRDRGMSPGHVIANNLPLLLKIVFVGPFLELGSGLNGVLGLIILAIGLRTAWRLAAGSPGFGQPGASRAGLFGLR